MNVWVILPYTTKSYPSCQLLINKNLSSVRSDWLSGTLGNLFIALTELSNKQVEHDYCHQKQEYNVDNHAKPPEGRRVMIITNNCNLPESSITKNVRVNDVSLNKQTKSSQPRQVYFTVVKLIERTNTCIVYFCTVYTLFHQDVDRDWCWSQDWTQLHHQSSFDQLAVCKCLLAGKSTIHLQMKL